MNPQGAEVLDQGSGPVEPTPQGPAADDLRLFFKYARAHCCNYTQAGPNHKQHYCWLEPGETEHTCLLASGRKCAWFEQAVLPGNQDLQAEWLKLVKAELMPRTWRICQCGQRFKATSNRQLRCTDCSNKNRMELLRKAKRRQRAKGS